MDYVLPSTTYPQQPRPARRLNTIIEEGQKSDSSDTDEGTIIGRPSELDEKLFVAVPRERRTETRPVTESLPSQQHEEWGEDPSQFDDMYDVSDNETEFSDSCPSLRDSLSSRPTSFGTDSERFSVGSNRSSRNRYPSLLIPANASLPSLASPHKNSPVPPTPPPKIPVSPAILDLLPSLVPALHATPSLDGSSVTSEQVSTMSAPVTPDMQSGLQAGNDWGSEQVQLRMHNEIAEDAISEADMDSGVSIVIEQIDDWSAALDSFPSVSQEMRQRGMPTAVDEEARQEATTPSDTGVELPLDALDTLRVLSGLDSTSCRSDSPKSIHSAHEMREVSGPPSRPRSAESEGQTPASEQSGYSFSELSIPSPGGFFSSLDADAQDAWAVPTIKEPEVPTSAVAERFYNLPWDRAPSTMEQIVEADEMLTDGPPTARQAEFPISPQERRGSYHSDEIEETPREEYEESYENELLQTATSNLDRTSVWLAAQTSYLAILKQTDGEDQQAKESDVKSVSSRNSAVELNTKKAVRFEENPVSKVDSAMELPNKGSLFYRGVQHVIEESNKKDAFIHQSARFDAMQAARIASVNSHVDILLGKYDIVERWKPQYSGPFTQNPRQTGVFEMTRAQIAHMKCEHEQLALDQLLPSSWVIDAMKYVNGGRLLSSPASKKLAKATLPPTDPRCVGKRRVRVLDLGGQGSCDWGWHCASQYPNVKVYTVTTKQQTVNTEVHGPTNHRVVSVPRLWQLPFKAGHFDLISARSLHTLLRSDPDIPSTPSELDMCIFECQRILKPGGHLEYSLIDATIARAGPRASALSVEFGFNLKTRGYDPEPTKQFLGRLRRAHFMNTKSAWLFLPMGAETPEKQVLRETPFPQCPSVTDLAKYEAIQGPVGSTANAANMAGLVGGWMWEQWKCKLEKDMEIKDSREKWLEGFSDAIEEGRDCGAGYKMLTGWCQKPLRRRRQGGLVKPALPPLPEML